MHPVLFHLGPDTPVYSYSVFLIIATVAALVLCVVLARRERVDVAGFLIGAPAGAIAGSRVLGLVESMLAEPGGGGPGLLTVYGALAGIAGGLALAARIQRVSFLVLADIAAPAVALSVGLGRVGCYLFGCDFGRPLGSWAPSWLAALGTFPRWTPGLLGSSSPSLIGSPAWSAQVHARLIDPSAPAALPVHPTQLYELLLGLGLCAALLRLRGRRAFQGQVALVFVIAFGAWRFLMDFVLDGADRARMGPLTFTQWLGVATAIGAAALYSSVRALPPWSPASSSKRKARGRVADEADDAPEEGASPAPKPVRKKKRRKPPPAVEE